MSILYSTYYLEHDPFGMFDDVLHITDHRQLPTKYKKGDAVFLWGGEDIGTSLYGETPNKMCHAYKPTVRDLFEINVVKYSKGRVPLIGICRGAQLMCVLAGGKLLQHIEGHDGGNHLVTLHDEDNALAMSNSCHHQMMQPGRFGEVLASCKETIGLGEGNLEVKVGHVPEVVYFPTLNGLGIQSHPEWGTCSSEFVEYCKRKIKEKLVWL